MTPKQLDFFGRALFGERWQTPLSRVLEVNPRTIRRWAAGEWPVPDDKAEDIREMFIAKRTEQALDAIDDVIETTGGKPKKIVLNPKADPLEAEISRRVSAALKERGIEVDD